MLNLIILVAIVCGGYLVWKRVSVYKEYIIGAMILIFTYGLIGLKGMLIIGLAIIFIMVLNDNSYYWKFKKWSKSMANTHNYTGISIEANLNEISKLCDFSFENVPFGRASWFANSFDNLEDSVEMLSFLGYSPIRSKIKEEFAEYGFLLTTSGILCKNQCEGDNKQYTTDYTKLPFKGLWGVQYNQDELNYSFYYPTGIRKISLNIDTPDTFVDLCTALIATGYTNDLYTGATVTTLAKSAIEKSVQSLTDLSKDEMESSLDNKIKDETAQQNTAKKQESGVYNSVAAHTSYRAHKIQLNQMVSGRQGHGVAAEYANDTVDKIQNPLKNVRQLGQDNAPSGVDRAVGKQKIQTKYYKTANGSFKAAFDKNGQYKYKIGSKPMQLEVPKDQYKAACAKARENWRNMGVKSPAEAEGLIRCGHVTYEESLAIARGGNLTSIKYSLADGVVQSSGVAGISFAIVFAQAKWAGMDNLQAAKMAGATGLKTLITGSLIYASSLEVSKILTNELKKKMGNEIAAKLPSPENMAKGAGYVFAFVLEMGPDVFDSIRGRISVKQLTKDAVSAGSGIAGGVAGAKIGTEIGTAIAPGPGTVVGAIAGTVGGFVGGMVAHSTSKKLMDHFIEDDAIEMFAELKEEFLDVACSISISKSEFEQLQNTIFDDKVSNKLKDMFAAYNPRQYIRNIISEQASSIISQRKQVTATEVDEAYGIVQAELAS